MAIHWGPVEQATSPQFYDGLVLIVIRLWLTEQIILLEALGEFVPLRVPPLDFLLDPTVPLHSFLPLVGRFICEIIIRSPDKTFAMSNSSERASQPMS